MKKTILTLIPAVLFSASLLTAQTAAGPIVVQVEKCITGLTATSPLLENALVTVTPGGEAFTDVNGSATIIPNAPVGTPVKVSVIGSDNQGVTVWDVLLLSRHVLGIAPFDLPCQFIAGDVNGSGSVSIMDVIEVRKWVLGLPVSSPVDEWRFWNADVVIPDPANPFGVVLEDEIELMLNTVNPELKFNGVKLGDVNGSANFKDDMVEGRSQLQMPDRFVLPGETFTLSIPAPADQAAWQMTLELDQLSVEEIIPQGSLSDRNFGLFPHDNGTNLTFATEAPQQSFDVRLRARSGGFLSEMVRMSNKITPSVSFDRDGNRSNLGLQFSPLNNESIQLAPNPWRNNALVTFTAVQPEKVTFTVLNALGQEVYQNTENYPPGQHQVELNRQQVPFPGIYWCKMARNNQVETLKFVVE